MTHTEYPRALKNYNSELSLFIDICHLLESRVNLEDTLNPIFMIVVDHFEIEDGAITIYDAKKEIIHIDSSYGLTVEEQLKGQYQIGEGIIGQVVQTQKAMLIPDISQEPRFLEKTKKRSHPTKLSFICIPILYQQKVLGTISITPPQRSLPQLIDIANKLKVLSFLIAPAVVQRLSKKYHIEQVPFSQNETSELNLENILGNSGVIRDFKQEMYRHAKEDEDLLIMGEEGSGKTFFAHAIHNGSSRKAQKPNSYYCYKSREDNSELIEEFTHMLHSSQNSTLIIEECSLLPVTLQQFIVRLIETDEYEHQGVIHSLGTRFIFITTEKMSFLKQGALIPPLLALLAKNILNVPSLRERKNDVLIFMNYFLQEENRKTSKNIKRISTPAINLLNSYHWPGNLSELQQVIRYAHRSCEGGVIHAHLLPPSLQSSESSNTASTISFTEKISQVENDLIVDALKMTKGKIKKAAMLLQLTERQLGLRIGKYNINTRDYR